MYFLSFSLIFHLKTLIFSSSSFYTKLKIILSAMTSKTGMRERRIPLMGPSVDDWLDERRGLDGAEGLWRIHDKLYDFTMWSRFHPGGKFWLDISRGTDITEAFESHHLSNNAESLLQNYYMREALTPRNFFTIFSENGFYRAFKRKLCQQQLLKPNESYFPLTFLSDSLAIAVFLTSLLATKYGVTWIIISGLLLGILSISSHSFLHMRGNWRVHYLNLSLMSSRDWRIRHVLGHHQYRNTNSDLEIIIWRLCSEGNEEKCMQLIPNLLLFPFAAHIQFLQRFLDVLLSRKLGFQREELVAFSLPLFMLLFSGVQPWDVFVTWSLILLIGSFVFCLSSSGFCTGMQIKSEIKTERDVEDFGTVQLSHASGHPKDNESVFSFLNSFRGNVLHYLCPAINCGSLRKFIPVFEETVNEFGIGSFKSHESLAEALQSRMPEGHLFFS